MFSSKINYPLCASMGIIIILGTLWFLDSPIKQAVTVGYGEIEYLKGKNLNFVELTKFFSKLAEEKGGEYAYKSLAYATSSFYIPPNIDTHLLGHVVGDELYKQQGLEGMKYCTDDMRNACSHSIVVGGLLAEGIEAINKMVEVCHKAPGGKGAYRMCVHGLGHGVLAYSDYDMRQAVELCKPIATSADFSNMEFKECVGGITMEMMAGINDRDAWERQKNKYFKTDDPLSPCNMDFIPVKAAGICFNFLTPHLFEAAGANLGRPLPADYKQAFTFCEKIPKDQKENRSTCFGGFGKEFVVLVNDRNVQSIEDISDEKLKTIYDWCNLAVEEGRGPCLSSAMQSLYWGGENNRDVAIRYCRLMDESNQNFCFESLIEAVRYYIDSRNYRQEFCSEVPISFYDRCQTKLLK